jgi:hypothetical protein
VTTTHLTFFFFDGASEVVTIVYEDAAFNEGAGIKMSVSAEVVKAERRLNPAADKIRFRN